MDRVLKIRIHSPRGAQPIPHSPPLVDAMIPDVDQIVDALMRLAEAGKSGSLRLRHPAESRL
jgi:hypothetical protein